MNLDELLVNVQKPGRYIGGEWNSVRKEWTSDKVKVLLAFPDVYEVGMSYLGLKILYGILNKRDDCLCERVFSPWTDFEDALRKNGASLASLESRHSIKDFDIIGFSLAYELNYTNVLNILDLGNIPLRSSERNDSDPLVIAGGPSCYNPEPMAEFIDAFVIGDGEEVIEEIVDAYKETRDKRQETRKRILEKLAKIKGIYVPSLYKEGISPKIKKRIVQDLDKSFYPVDQVVPYIQTVHDRIAIEIMRGCKHACSFCQAGTTYHPFRERSKEKILEIARASYRSTGYEEISLLSLSSADHSRIRDIVKDLNEIFKDKAVSISVPSLRIEDILKDLPGLLSRIKKPGLTFAPEAGSECLRKVINKNIDIDKLFYTISESFRAGWQRVKLYFMIGLPAEKEEDLIGIVDLIYKIAGLRKEVDGRQAFVTASINAFVPKPHTPFQRKAMDRMEELVKKREILKSTAASRSKGKFIKLDFHSFDMSYLEAVFSRGDRRLSDVVYEAWKAGARFDGWEEFFNFKLWIDSFRKAGADPELYASRGRDPNEKLPWNFIDIGASSVRSLTDTE